jgi:hypothetical protein
MNRDSGMLRINDIDERMELGKRGDVDARQETRAGELISLKHF